MTGEPRPRYNALQLLGVSGACGYNWVAEIMLFTHQYTLEFYHLVLRGSMLRDIIRSMTSKHMVASWNGRFFRVTGALYRQFTAHWWIPLTKGRQCGDLRLHDVHGTCACANLIKTPFTKLLQFMEFMRTDMPSGFECCTWSIGIYRDHGLYQISWYITLSDKIDYFIFLNQPKFKSSTGRVLSGAVAGLAALEYVKQPWNPVPMRTRRSGQLLH